MPSPVQSHCDDHDTIANGQYGAVWSMGHTQQPQQQHEENLEYRGFLTRCYHAQILESGGFGTEGKYINLIDLWRKKLNEEHDWPVSYPVHVKQTDNLLVSGRLFSDRPNPFPRPLLCERTASANQIAGKWCDCSFGRSSLGSCLSKSSIMEAPVDEQCITMEDLGPIQPKFPDEQRCMQIKSVAKEIKIFSIRKDYVAKMLEVEESDPSNNKETKVTLETELKSLEEKIAILEALNTANEDDEDVSPPKYKIKPIFMRMVDSYNLILQEIHRNYPTATNTHTKGYMKIEAQSADDHREITNYLKENNLSTTLLNPIHKTAKTCH
ncbi:uncharacterized protein TNCV_1548001 [Trichonephila clavipes]|nr:uncharacterized protein TNCV_1548001 [Trichonephila clavipes]